MCDYSLHADPTRLAEEGEQLVAHRFPTGSMGLASPCELTKTVEKTKPQQEEKWYSWQAIRNWFQTQAVKRTEVAAVCIPPGARLVLRDIPKEMQQELGIAEEEEVTFTELTASAHTYRDAVRFSNGRQILLQRLREGQRVEVMSLSISDPVELEQVYRRRLMQVR